MKSLFLNSLTIFILSLSAYAAETQPSPPKYFGFFGSAMSGVGTGNYIAAVSKISNFVHIRETDQTVLLQKMQQAQQANLFILMDVQLYAHPWQSVELHADWKLRIAKLLELLAPYKANIIGFYLYDEPYWNNSQLGYNRLPEKHIQENLNSLASYLKQIWPTKKTALTFAYKELTKNLLIPKQVDWLGFNCYAAYGDDCSDQKIQNYFHFLIQEKEISQKLMITLDAYWNSRPTSYDQQVVLNRLELWKKLIKSSNEVEVLVPFLYQNHPAENLWGVESLPAVGAALKNYFEELNIKAP